MAELLITAGLTEAEQADLLEAVEALTAEVEQPNVSAELVAP